MAWCAVPDEALDAGGRFLRPGCVMVAQRVVYYNCPDRVMVIERGGGVGVCGCDGILIRQAAQVRSGLEGGPVGGAAARVAGEASLV